MSSQGGLSRRRVPNQSNSSTTQTDSNSSNDSRNGTTPTPSNNGHSQSHSHAGSAFRGGGGIAYDPRDLDTGDEDGKGGKLPRLTIMEEVLLLGLKDKQGYLSFWNDNISYALRGCILIELALRRRIALVKDPNRRRLAISERLVEVLSDKITGETILDEALKMMKAQEAPGGERMSVGSWIDLMSGETWNLMKISFQLKQVRERLLKGLVDKGVLRTEKRNFLLFDMATHPVADVRTKDGIVDRVVSLLTATTTTIPERALDKDGTQCRVMRAVCLVCAAYAASVLDNAFGRLTYEDREAAFSRCDEIMTEFSAWPLGSGSGSTNSRRANRIAVGGGSSGVTGREIVIGLAQEAKKESTSDSEEDLGFELIAGVLEVLSKLDSLL